MKRRTMLTTAAAVPLFGASSLEAGPGSYEIWDVFSGQRLSGNPLAVFPDASQLQDAKLGAIAREMAHSETTFVFPRTNAIETREGVRTRIFSRAGEEMPFAGHPVLGTAFAMRARRPVNEIALAVPAGRVPVMFRQREDGAWEGEMTQPDPVFAETHERGRLAAMLGLSAGDFDPALPLENVSTGRPNVLVLLNSREAVGRATVDWRALGAYFAGGDRERGVYLLSRDVEQPGAQFHARKPTRSGDDPVTGSAAGCAIAALVKHGLVDSGKRIVMEQGSEVRRRGELFASAVLSGGRVSQVHVGGQAVCSARGTLLL